MSQSPAEFVTLATRAQVMLERLKSGEVLKFRPFLERMERDLRMRITAADIDSYQSARVAALLRSIEDDLSVIFGEYRTALTGDLIDIAVDQAIQEAEQFKIIAADPMFEPVVPAALQVRAAVMSAPLSVKGYNEGALLEPWLEKWSDGQKDAITGAIRNGYYQGQSTAQIVKELRGTAGLNYKDGVLARIDRSNATVVRTAVQHMAQTARNEFYADNSDIVKGVKWVSTLDSRTTIQCSSLDGRIFPLKSGPRPPLHPGCRSTTVPVLDDAFDVLDKGATRSSKGDEGGQQVNAKETYYEWLKKQPADFQEIAIGDARAKLLRDGGLSADDFARLQLGTNFKPLTLDEMRKLRPAAFSRAGL